MRGILQGVIPKLLEALLLALPPAAQTLRIGTKPAVQGAIEEGEMQGWKTDWSQ